MIEQFKQEMASGELANVLGINKNLTGEQEQSLKRLEDKWMSGMQGHYNAAAEERKPLMISFDDDDNILSTEVAAITIVSNGFDGGEERSNIPGEALSSTPTTNEVRRDGSEDPMQKPRPAPSPTSSIGHLGWFTQTLRAPGFRLNLEMTP